MEDKQDQLWDCGIKTSIEKIWKGFDSVKNVIIAFKNISFYRKQKNKRGNICWLGDSKGNYGEEEVWENK